MDDQQISRNTGLINKVPVICITYKQTYYCFICLWNEPMKAKDIDTKIMNIKSGRYLFFRYTFDHYTCSVAYYGLLKQTTNHTYCLLNIFNIENPAWYEKIYVI